MSLIQISDHTYVNSDSIDIVEIKKIGDSVVAQVKIGSVTKTSNVNPMDLILQIKKASEDKWQAFRKN
jgi:hypothetical protein